ncbi:HAD family hydrolase [Paenibacillus sp. JCM 10914]|uniref:HAD family hydrolase n=1 Tax=Paenibacillus sp. JCM 10914 TaxID=1236974 RepID=UPI0003CC5E4B|nr:HAD family hydrolase [Paenibacillus sp. JCM 10914]GAE04721.1 phosphoglycolate phosphatase [Paenibacillus sp. JCM 10914]
MNYQHILLDLDGTLTDPREGITKSVQYALGKHGIVEEDLSKLECFIGPPLQVTFAEIYEFNEEKAWHAVQSYREYFKETGLFENEVYAGIREVLDLLKSQGKLLYVATSKPMVFAQRILEHFELESYFTMVCGSELDGSRSDKTDVIQHVLDTYQLDPSQCVMVGDRKHDLIGAHNCKMDSIAVGYGYGSEDELSACKPTIFVQTVEELRQSFVTVAV